MLISPRSKQKLEAVCKSLDTTASQVVRQLIRLYTESGGSVLERQGKRR